MFLVLIKIGLCLKVILGMPGNFGVRIGDSDSKWAGYLVGRLGRLVRGGLGGLGGLGREGIGL